MEKRPFNGVVISFLFLVLGIGPSGWAIEVTGNLTFDGAPVGDAFPEKEFGEVVAFNVDTHERTHGSVDVGEGTYSVDLIEGTYNFSVVLGEAEDTDFSSYFPGNIWGNETGIAVGSGGTQTIDFLMYYLVHVTAPFDNDDLGALWGGSATDCPFGPEVTRSFRLDWDPVPGVNRYEVQVNYLSCSDWVRNEVQTTSNTSVDIGIVPAEADTVGIWINGFGSSGYSVVSMPYLIYDNGSVGTFSHWLHATEGEGRPIHSVDSTFLIQVARLAGVGSSYWTSDVTLSNPGPAAAQVTLTFTPRGSDGLVDFETRTFEVPAFGSRTIKDVVGSIFGRTAAGSLEISPSSIRAYARTATSADAGSYGQFFPAVAVDGGRWASLSGGEILQAAGVIRGPFRTNLILAELWGESTSVAVKLVDMDGVELGAKSYTLPALGNIQINDVVKVLTGNAGLEVEDAQIQLSVTSGDGRVAGALSLVDQGSDDPITVVLE